jgi:hypothetical protein
MTDEESWDGGGWPRLQRCSTLPSNVERLLHEALADANDPRHFSLHERVQARDVDVELTRSSSDAGPIVFEAAHDRTDAMEDQSPITAPKRLQILEIHNGFRRPSPWTIMSRSMVSRAESAQSGRVRRAAGPWSGRPTRQRGRRELGNRCEETGDRRVRRQRVDHQRGSSAHRVGTRFQTASLTRSPDGAVRIRTLDSSSCAPRSLSARRGAETSSTGPPSTETPGTCEGGISGRRSPSSAAAVQRLKYWVGRIRVA